MKELLKKVGVLNADETTSITNCVVFLFVLITSFKLLFGGVSFDLGWFHWKIESMDISGSLPLLFSLLNYGHKRMIGSQQNGQQSQ